MKRSHQPPQEVKDYYYVPRIRQKQAMHRAAMNAALRRFCFPIPILALLACMTEAGAATPCDLVAERVRVLEVETATAIDAWERKDAVVVCRYRDLAGPAIDSYRREVAACIRDVRFYGPQSAEAKRVIERVRAGRR